MLELTKIRTLLDEFNVKYFAAKLPRYRVLFVDHITYLGELGDCSTVQKRIRIRRGLSESETIGTLLHEMVHAAVGYGHGKPFRREIERLRDAGAPLAEGEVAILESDQCPLTKCIFKTYVMEALDSTSGKISFGELARHIIWDGAYPVPSSIAKFRNQLWGTPAAFRESRSEYTSQIRA